MSRLEFYTVDLKYVERLHQFDKEVFYDANSQFYEKKLYIGILTMMGGHHYFISLTSAKTNIVILLVWKLYVTHIKDSHFQNKKILLQYHQYDQYLRKESHENHIYLS